MNKLVFKRLIEELKKYPQKPKLLAVTKYSDIEEINNSIENWVYIIWENRLEIAKEKFSKLKFDVEKHFIWVLQTKKIPQIVQIFDVIESVWTIKHLEKINSVSLELNKKTKVFLQFNISGEKQKSWFQKDEIEKIIKILENLKNIEILWIMWMWSNSTEQQNREEFKLAKDIFDILKKEISTIKELSLWMSNDYKIALEQGSTIVRIWSLLFK